MNDADLKKFWEMRALREDLAKLCAEKGYDLDDVFFAGFDYFEAPKPENLQAYSNDANFVRKHGEDATRAWLSEPSRRCDAIMRKAKQTS